VAPDPREGTDQLRPSLLTEREGQVLELLGQMNSTEEIAAALFVSTNTVKTHLKGIFGKLGVNRRVDAVRRGRALGLC
jgi:LuxR family maltose regulon positive regulatory protein